LTEKEFYDIIYKEEDEGISLTDLYILTGHTFDIDVVRKNTDYYDNTFKHIYRSHGFTNMYDFILFAMSNTETLQKGGNKNLSNLNKVKRKVMRNGKMIDMTIYEDSNSDDEGNKDGRGQNNSDDISATKARVEDNGDFNIKPNPKKIASYVSKFKSLGSTIPKNITNSDMYKEIKSSTGLDLGVIAISNEEDFVKLDGYIANPNSTGVGLRAILESLKTAIKVDKALMIYDIQLPQAIEYLNYLGFKKVDGGFIMSKKDVRNFLGEHSDFI